MTAETFKNRLKKRYTGSKSAKAYRIVLDLINGTNETRMVSGNIIRPCHTSGHGRYCTNLDYTEQTKNLLTLLGVKFESGNDAPRGGLTGNFIKVITKIARD